MPFEKIDASRTITDALAADPELKRMWNGSRAEYSALGNLNTIERGKKAIMEEPADEAFCLQLYNDYQAYDGKGEAVDIESFAKSLGITL